MIDRPVLVLDLEDIDRILSGDLSILTGFKSIHSPEEERTYRDAHGLWRCSHCDKGLIWGKCPRCDEGE